MALTISATTPADHIPLAPAPAPRAAPTNDADRQPVAQAPTGPAAASPAQEAAALSQLLNRYKIDQANGAPANSLTGLGRQIFAAAKAAGQRVTLPHAPAAAGAVSAAPIATAAAETGRVDVTA
jgi:hypothetical protein